MIKKFIIRFLFISICFFGILIVVLLLTSKYVESKEFKNSETESNTLVIKDKRKYDLLFMGISHARNFSKCGNHEIVEKILHKKIINIGQGGGVCGINEQLFYLNYFYSKGNSADTVVLILTPSMLTATTLPIASGTFDLELFNLNFLYQYLLFSSENKYERIIEYSQSKLKSKWINLEPDCTICHTDSLKTIDELTIQKGILLARPKHINMERFKKSCSQVEKIVNLAKKNNSKITMIIPPALFTWPEQNLVVNFVKKIKEKQDLSFYDFSKTVEEPRYYYDHHHLNNKGIEYFTKAYLKPIF